MYYPEYNEGAVYQSTAPYYVGSYSGQQEPPVGFMNSPLVSDIANSFNMNRNAIYSNYGYSQQYIGYNQQPYGQYNQYGNGYYNPYYDPYEARRRAEYEAKIREQQHMARMKVWEAVVKANLKFYGQEMTGSIFEDSWEVPQEYHPKISIMSKSGNRVITLTKNYEEPHEIVYENGFRHYQRESEEFDRRAGLLRLVQLRDQQEAARMQQEEEYKRRYQNYSYSGKNESLYEFLHGSGRERYIQFEFDDRLKHQKRNVGAMYNRDQFDSVMDIYKINEEARRQPTTISPGLVVNGLDDISITLPEHLKSEYQERRDQFMSAIMKRNPNMHIPEHNLPPNKIGSGG